MPLSRRALLAEAGAGALALAISPALAGAALLRREVPSTGEMIPVMGLGTARHYEVVPRSDGAAHLRETLERFVALGGAVIDTAPSYGSAEAVLGLILSEGLREKVFLASKVSERECEAAGGQIERSFARLRTRTIDLIAIHNLIGIESSLAVLRDLKAAGRVRTIGLTIWRDDQFAELESVMKREPLDFIQVNYALDDRKAAERILPLAQERGIAAMIGVPFGRDRLFAAVENMPLPGWAAEFDCRSWPQFFLKYVLANEAVTCLIPGMARRAHVEDNCAAATGRIPDPGQRRRMESLIDAV